MIDVKKCKPAVTKHVLIFLAGSSWGCVGAALLMLAFSWLAGVPGNDAYWFAGGGVVVALLAHHFGFLRIVDRNLKRLLPMNAKTCLFAFIPWKSYLIILIMITMGAALRHSVIPKPYLAIVYIGVGLALLLSSFRYLRVFIREIRRGRTI